MSDAPSHSNADIERPRRSIARFMWFNAAGTALLALAVALTFDNAYLLYPIAFGTLIAGTVLVFREMFALLGEDSQYAPEAAAIDDAEPAADQAARAATRATVTPTAHAA